MTKSLSFLIRLGLLLTFVCVFAACKKDNVNLDLDNFELFDCSDCTYIID